MQPALPNYEDSERVPLRLRNSMWFSALVTLNALLKDTKRKGLYLNCFLSFDIYDGGIIAIKKIEICTDRNKILRYLKNTNWSFIVYHNICLVHAKNCARFFNGYIFLSKK